MTIKSSILSLLAVLISVFSFGQNTQNVQFVENKGQWDSRVKFMAEVPAGAIYIHNNGFTIVQHNPDDFKQITDKVHGSSEDNSAARNKGAITLRSHAYKVDFVNGAAAPQIVADKPLYTYHNYFIGDDPAKWATNCKVYQGITVKNVYPNVDVRYYSENGKLKYDMIVQPGADPSRIALKYNGVDKIETKDKELLIPTSVGTLKELAPYSYQYNLKGRKEVGNRYMVKDNVVKFDLKNYDATSPLIIDPTLIFCSFTGASKDNWGFTATYGPDGSMYAGGISLDGGFPVSPGAFQTEFGGGVSNPVSEDMAIIKLTPDGSNRVYATFIGGKGNEQPHSLIVDGLGNLVIAGRTSSENYPIKGAGKFGPNGSYDIVVTKLNATGTGIIGSIRVGGSGDDGVNINPTRSGVNSLQQNYGDDGRSEVILDRGGDILVASSTQSTNFYVKGGFQATNGGKQDGVLLRIDPDVSTVLYSTYFGGSGNDAAYVLSINPASGNIYVAGGTESSNLPGNSANTIGPVSNGNIDGYVAIVNPTLSTLIKTTYLGTSGVDQVYGVQFDRRGFPYVTGQTTGDWPIVNAQYVNAGAKQFISKLQPDLSSYVYSTVFGKQASDPSISPTAFLVDRCENVYVSGWGGSVIANNGYPSSGTSGLPITSDAVKSSTDGKDFYFFVLRRDATQQLFGSFFGQNGGGADHVDGGTSRFDANGVIYQAMCANCKGLNPPQGTPPVFPTTPGAWAEVNPSSGCNLAMVKIEMNFSGVRSGIQSAINGVPRDTAGCVPLTVDFSDTVLNAVSYEWNFGDGSPMEATSSPNISHTYNQTGDYRIMLVAIDESTCNLRDTSYMNIKVGDLKAALNFNPVKLNPCDSFKYRFDNLSIPHPTQPFTSTSFIWDFGDGSPRIVTGAQPVFHNYATPGSYSVKLILLDSAYCNYPDSLVQTLRVAALVKAQFVTPPVGCIPLAVQFENTSDGGQQFLWSFGDGTTSTSPNPEHTYTAAGTYNIKLIAIDSATCNLKDSASAVFVVANNPTAAFSLAPQPPTENTPINFTNLSSPEASRFVWNFGDGDTLATTSKATLQHEYNTTGTFTACLIAFNDAGCSDTTCQPVQTLVNTAVDVPNAFTPLSGDVNSKVFVKGYGISKMKFIVWARWGEKVFETADKNIGWDGRFKGAVLPMDVYAYTLEVEFTDGTRID